MTELHIEVGKSYVGPLGSKITIIDKVEISSVLGATGYVFRGHNGGIYLKNGKHLPFDVDEIEGMLPMFDLVAKYQDTSPNLSDTTMINHLEKMSEKILEETDRVKSWLNSNDFHAGTSVNYIARQYRNSLKKLYRDLCASIEDLMEE